MANYFSQNPPSPRVRAASLLGIVMAVGFTKLVDYDIWWHLITGELIWKWQQILPYDIFSYTAPGTPWINHEWLYQVIAWLLLDNFGVAAFSILKLVLAACIAWAVYNTFKILIRSQSVALWGTVIMIFGIGDRIMDRPFLFSIFITAWFILELYRFADGRRKKLWLLPVIQVVWINLHGAGIMGPEIVMAFALGESLQRWLGMRDEINGADVPVRGSTSVIDSVTYFVTESQRLWPRRPEEARPSRTSRTSQGVADEGNAADAPFISSRPVKAPSPIDAAKLRHLWLIGFACLAACAINPYGIDVYILSFGLPEMKYIMMFTQEWIPALDSRLGIITSQIIFRILAVAVMASYIINRKNARLSHVFLTAITVLLVLNGRRFTTDFILVNLPILFYNLKDFVRYFVIIPQMGYFHAWLNVSLVAIISVITLIFGVPVTIKGGTTGEFGVGTNKMFAPAGMVDFLDKNDIHGRVFSEMGVGGYLMFRRWPRDLVFLDGRTPIYGEEFYRRFIEAFKQPKNFEELDKEWRFDYLVLTTAQVWDIRDFHKALWESGRWKLVYADASEGLVYVRDDPKFKGVIDKFALKNHPVIDLMKCTEKADHPNDQKL